MDIYCVQGIRHSCFVQADSPENAIEVAKKIVDKTWECPYVMKAEFQNGVLTTLLPILYETNDFE